MDFETIYQVFDGARCVVVDEDSRLIGTYHGGSTFNLYDETGRAVDCFMVSPEGSNIPGGPRSHDSHDAQAILCEHFREMGEEAEDE